MTSLSQQSADDNNDNDDDLITPSNNLVATIIKKKQSHNEEILTEKENLFHKHQQKEKKKKEEKMKQEEEKRKKKLKKNQKLVNKNTKGHELEDFLQGAILYGLCLTLPTILGFLVRFYEEITFPEEEVEPEQETILENIQSNFNYYYETYGKEPYNKALDRLCPADPSTMTPFTYSWNSYLCEQLLSKNETAANDDGHHHHFTLRAQDTNVKHDIINICILSAMFAFIRIGIVHVLVPVNKKDDEEQNSASTERLVALVRRKSDHLLSRYYPLSPSPHVSKKTNKMLQQSQTLPPPPPLLVAPEVEESAAGDDIILANNDINDDDGDDNDDEDDFFIVDNDDDAYDYTNDYNTSSPTPYELQHIHNEEELVPMKSGDDEDDNKKATATATAEENNRKGDNEESFFSSFMKLFIKQAKRQSKMIRTSSRTTLGLLALEEEGEQQQQQQKEQVNTTSSINDNNNNNNNANNTTTDQRMFAGPRYATAVFKFLYTLFICTLALCWFRDTDFWPIYVGGTKDGANTKNCWNLSGSFLSYSKLDYDFDDNNSKLKSYFLLQASYHLHSLTFHCISMIILAIYSSSSSTNKRKSNNNNNGEQKQQQQQKNHRQNNNRGYLLISGIKSYARSLVQHIIVIIFIISSYFFSSLRRLNVIGMFAIDFSSIFLHLLQMLINMPYWSSNDNNDNVNENEKQQQHQQWKKMFIITTRRKDQIIKFLHHFIVIPIYLYTRFFILIFIVYYSMVYESKLWIKQMERTLFPGIFVIVNIVFHMLMITVIVINLILFRRLLFHPQICNNNNK